MRTTALPFRAVLLAVAVLLPLGGCSAGGQGTASPGLPSPTSSAVPSSPSASPSPSPSASPSASPGASPNASAPASEAADPIRERIERMTLSEKIGQMIIAGIEGKTMGADARSMLADSHVGGVILYADNIDGVKGTVSLINSLKSYNKEHTDIPLFMSVDQEGGKVSRLPSSDYAKIPTNQVVGETADAKLAGQMGQLLARELLSAGFNLDFAPVLDVNSNPDNPVIGSRSFGSSPQLVAELGVSELEGLRKGGVIPVAKHFPGHGDTSVDSHLDLPVVNKTADELTKLEWVPFEAAIDADAEAIMVAHILYPKLDSERPASLSDELVGHWLREKLGYDGVVITDDLTMGAIAKHYTLPAAAVDAVQAGNDILLVAHGADNLKTVREALLNAVASGELDEARIDESVYRIMRLKTDYSLKDEETPVPDLSKLNKDIEAWRNSL
ncbi:beta-N-acetylhexosaminidase [Cohnella fermenti]|uniref:Beta-N-acetylhexosaminidase n=1 Tax=Cohnella fermenti TaxID=2565925 RepID=A0A4S4BH50_9BACL|nr:beta-N-acetylhexosaminidase [Cohnella fermenti]THF73849.1 beta-N-acetylhexosaminidase [Cohnella fermenti]